MSLPRITLLTDFGTGDGYVAAMKGVMAGIVPDVILDDASHAVLRGDIRAGGRALSRYWDRYPPGTVHLAVVDPGVGTGRRVLAARADGRLLVAPDNGLVTIVLERAESWTAVEATDEELFGPDRSATFHGRDVFAPVAAHLARGVPLEEAGPPLERPVRLEEPLPRRTGSGTRGEVVSVDRFGNLATNVPSRDLPAEPVVRIAGESLTLSRTFADVEPGRLLALVNSDGMLEVAVRDGSAARRLGAERGTVVEVREDPGDGASPGS